jgi:hypothetical protein
LAKPKISEEELRLKLRKMRLYLKEQAQKENEKLQELPVSACKQS